LPTPLAPKKRRQVTEKLVHSSSSFIVVQNEMLLSEMNDRINEMVIYEEPTDPDNSIDLLADTEKLDATVSLDTALTIKPKHTFEIKRTDTEYFPTRTVGFTY
jgi:hypothetical protein